MLPYIDCLGKYDETCGDQVPTKVFPDEGEYESIRALTEDICDESTLIHAGIKTLAIFFGMKFILVLSVTRIISQRRSPNIALLP